MVTEFDKAIAALLPGVVAWINQKYGFHLNSSPEALTLLVGAVTSIIVYFVPNKPASS